MLKNILNKGVAQRQALKGVRCFSSGTNWIDQTRGLSYETSDRNQPDNRPRHFLLQNGKPISPWHDLRLKPENSDADVFNAVIEISRGTTAKYEVEISNQHNPIVQDQKKDKKTGELKLRHYALAAPFNYGMIPQTWENN